MKNIKWSWIVLLTAGLIGSLTVWAEKTGETEFVGYQGKQSWPTAESAQILTDYEVPIYIGLPDKKYEVLGRITDPRTSGLDAVGKAFDEGLESKKHQRRHVAAQAKSHNADAVIVTEDKQVIAVLGLDDKEIRETAPLFEHKHAVVLAVKFR